MANKTNSTNNTSGDLEAKTATFHDFLAPAGGDGRRRPDLLPSTVTEQGSERNAGNHLEGIPFYGSRGDLLGPENSNRFTGNKRISSDSFMVSSRDKFPKGQVDLQDNSNLTKLMRHPMGERSTHSPDDETSFVRHHQIGAISSFTNPSKWDKSSPVVSQYPPRSNTVTPFGYQVQANRIKETNGGNSVISQTAADEGSRTGIKGSGILSSMNAAGRQPSGVLVRSGKSKSGVSISEPEPFSQRRTESAGSQMTIFYGGQAHVFDNIQPNKADVIMSLAGSNGGSWSTVYTPNSSTKAPNGENSLINGDNNDTGAGLMSELHGKPSDKVDSYHGFSSGIYPGGMGSKERTASFKESKIRNGGKADERSPQFRTA